MTSLQHRCLVMIKAHIATHGVAPSYSEIAEALDMFSRSGAFAVVDALVVQGELIRTKARARNLRLPGVDLSEVPTADLLAELNRRGS